MLHGSHRLDAGRVLNAVVGLVVLERGLHEVGRGLVDALGSLEVLFLLIRQH